MLLARVYDRITAAEQRNIPAATAFLSPREQVLTGQLLRGMPLYFSAAASRRSENVPLAAGLSGRKLAFLR